MRATLICMTNALASSCLLSAVIAFCARICSAHEVGDMVVVIHDANLYDGDRVVDRVYPGITLRILKWQPDKIWVSASKPGWLETRYVVSFERGIEALTDVIHLNPDDPSYLRGRGIVWREKHNIDLAIADFNEALRLAPKSAAIYNDLGIARRDNEEYDQAINDFSKAIQLSPGYSGYYNNRGRAFQLMGEYGRAISDHNESIRLDPLNSYAFVNRGIAWNIQGKFKEATADYKEALRLDPLMSWALYRLAWLQATCPDPKYRNGKAAVENAKKLCEQTAWGDPSYIEALAAAYAEEESFIEAMSWQQHASDLNTNKVLKAKSQNRLQLYNQGMPYRDLPKR